MEWGGKANYHAFQMKAQSRNWHGASFLAAYTYSKCLDDGTGESGATTLLIPQNYGPCTFDLPQNFVFSYQYELPFGKGKSFLSGLPGWADQVLGGWRMAGITALQSGLPFTPTITSSPGVSSDRANTGVGSQRPNVIGKPIIVGDTSCWFFTSFNPSCAALLPGAQDAFAIPAQFTYGNSARDILRADGLVQLDFTLMKNFKLTESKSLEFRSEFFNITNTPTFKAPSTAFNSSSGGQVSSTLNAARTIEFALKLFF